MTEKMTKIGILDAFPQNEIKINWNKTPIDAYIRFLEQVDPLFTYEGYLVAQGEFPASPDECHAYLVTGSPKGVYDQDRWIDELKAFIRESYQSGKKMVGICFGHQILAHALGGWAEKSDKGWGFGSKRFEIYSHKPWMTGAPTQCTSYFVHQDQVLRLPPEAELLGGNDFCPNIIFELNDQVLGIQGHPEFTYELMCEIITDRENLVEPQVYQAALHSLENGVPDNILMAQWIVNFLTAYGTSPLDTA